MSAPRRPIPGINVGALGMNSTVPAPPRTARPAQRPLTSRPSRAVQSVDRPPTARRRPQTARQAAERFTELPGPRVKLSSPRLLPHRSAATTKVLVRSPVSSKQRAQRNSPPPTVRHIRYDVTPGRGHSEAMTPWRQEGWDTGWGSYEPECLVNLRKVAWGVEECQDRWYVAPFKMRLWAPSDECEQWDSPVMQLRNSRPSRPALDSSERVAAPFAGSEKAQRPEVMMVINLSTGYLHAVEYWDSNTSISDKVTRMSDLLVRAMRSSLIGARGRPSRPRKIGFADKEVANKIHVSLAQINIAVVHESVSRPELASMSKVFSYYARCKNGTQSPYHDIASLSAISDWQTARQFFVSAQQFPTLKMLPLRQGHDVLGVCHINAKSADVRYFVVLGAFDPENDARSYTYGVAMYDNLPDVLRHCSGKGGSTDQYSALGIGLGMMLYDYRCVPFDDIQNCEEMGIIREGDRPALHPIPVEYSLSPFDDPKSWVEGRFLFDYFSNISDEDLLWFEIFFKLMNEKGNYKLVNYVPSRIRLNLSTGEGYTVLVKGSKSTLASHVDTFESVLSHKPRKLKSASSGAEPATQRNATKPVHKREERIKPLMLGRQFAKKLKDSAIQTRLKQGDVDPTPKLEMVNSNMLQRPKRLESALKRLMRPFKRGDSQEDEVVPLRHDKALIVPSHLQEEKTRLMNLENAAAMLVDQHISRQMLQELHTVEESQHFQARLKVIGHAGVRHAKPVVRAEETGGAPINAVIVPEEEEEQEEEEGVV
eukprot:TRINITY_DN7852_c0_g1_i2.p1 TRINITY_DN7852_c0_g1~~TRINITY_DN7852_c0_g1_i2.p1  ORF type:complete len:767 (-),score=135.52 TRINITY_DN7852_c0_g1_i2:89-2389(-)